MGRLWAQLLILSLWTGWLPERKNDLSGRNSQMRPVIFTVLSLLIAAPANADVSSRDRKACFRAVAKQTHNHVFALPGTEAGEADETVYVGVGIQKAKWQCLIKRGIVVEVSSMVDEGAL
jgi:hypothetical protein